MAEPSILITGSSSGAGTTGQAKTNLVAGELVTLSDTANGAGTYLWELWTSTGSAVVLAGANTATPTFTAAASECYVAFVTFNGETSWTVNAIGDRVSTQGGCAVLAGGERSLVPGETDQFGGWDQPIDAMLADYRDGLLGGGTSVSGPGSSTDNAFVRFSGTDGLTLKNSQTVEDASGNVTIAGTLNGRTLSADGDKLDNIEANADVTDATNVASAGALMADGSADLTGNLSVDALVTIDGRDLSVDGAKLDGLAKLNSASNFVPSASNDDTEGYSKGSLWIHGLFGSTFIAGSVATGAAQWFELQHVNKTSSAPTVNDDAGDGYREGDLWWNSATDRMYVCTDTTIGAAVWIEVFLLSTSAGATIKSLYEAEADTNAFDDTAADKLTNIEALADVTDATNVAAAGAVMDSDFGSSGIMRQTGAGAYESNDELQAAVGSVVEVLADGATVTPTGNANGCTWTMGGSRTLAKPTAAVAAHQVINIEITVGGAGSWTLTLGAGLNLKNGGTALALSATPGAKDIATLVTFDSGTSWSVVVATEE